MNKNSQWFLATLLVVAMAAGAGCASTAATSSATMTAVQAEASEEEDGYEPYVTVRETQTGKKCKLTRELREAIAVGVLAVSNPVLAVESAVRWWVLD